MAVGRDDARHSNDGHRGAPVVSIVRSPGAAEGDIIPSEATVTVRDVCGSNVKCLSAMDFPEASKNVRCASAEAVVKFTKSSRVWYCESSRHKAVSGAIIVLSARRVHTTAATTVISTRVIRFRTIARRYSMIYTTSFADLQR